MDDLIKAVEYALDPRNDFLKQAWTHLRLSGVALLLAVVIGVPLGVFISRYATAARIVVNIAGIMRVIPSLAVLFLLIPALKTGFRPSVVALTLLAIPPLLINTEAGLRRVDAAVIEAGRGMGMSYWRLLALVQMPLALPVVVAGLRIATVEVIASATLATLIGGGGLGDFIAAGLALSRNHILLVGAIPVALFALAAELSLATLQRRLSVRRG